MRPLRRSSQPTISQNDSTTLPPLPRVHASSSCRDRNSHNHGKAEVQPQPTRFPPIRGRPTPVQVHPQHVAPATPPRAVHAQPFVATPPQGPSRANTFARPTAAPAAVCAPTMFEEGRKLPICALCHRMLEKDSDIAAYITLPNRK